MNCERTGAIFCFGELLLRLSTPPGARFSNAAQMAVNVGGAESNVAALLAQLGHEVEMLSVLPTSALGDLCLAELRRHGVGTASVVRAEGRLGLYFFEPNGAGGRIIYDRHDTAFAAEAGGFDWPTLADRARWFHLSGINLALGKVAADAALTAASAMRAAGVPISFDVNHRASLWEGKSEAELAAVRDLATMANVLFASPLDISRLIRMELRAGSADGRRAAAEAAFSHFPNIQHIASTRRMFDNTGLQIGARFDTRATGSETPSARISNVIDRIGSGDAFAGAVIDGILRGCSPEQCATAGLAAAVAKHGMAGDRWIGTRAELESTDPFDTGDIRR